MNEKGQVIIYHAPCPDGFAAAQVFRNASVERDFVPYTHGVTTAEQLLPRARGKSVIFVDVCPPITILKPVANVAKTVLVLDHHETGERISKEVTIPNVQFHMDMTKSGALLAYEWVNGSDAAIPEFLRLIDDHDRGVWQYEETRPFMEYLKIQPYDFGVYAELCSEQVVDEYTSAGRILVQGQTARVQQALSYVGKGVTSGMHYVILNANVDLTQHGQAMLQAHPEADMSVVWYLDYATGLYVFSFRSTKEHVNVAAYAKQFKGGGHKHAAGCRGDPSSAVVKIFL